MPIDVIQDTDREFIIRIISNVSADPYDLTGIVGANLKAKLTGENAPVEIEEGAGITVLNALAGKIKITLTPAQTLELKARDGQDIEIYIIDLAGNQRKCQLQGELNVKPCLFEA